MKYIYLGLAVYFEVLATLWIKDSYGFTKLKPSLMLMLYFVLSFVCMTIAANKLPLSIAYPVWTGCCITAISIIGVLYFNEPGSISKMLCITFIVLGVIGLTLNQ